MSDPDATGGAPTPASVSFDGARFVAGTVLAGRYRIVTLLGRGGMGEVYKADDLKLQQPIAIKFLPVQLGIHSAAVARFHREARISRQISHPNVCRVYDVGEVNGLHFLTMEFIDGEDLASLLRRIGRVPAEKAVQIARQLCAGLAAAHDVGVIHRDLKPANVMLDGRGRARIMDFGIAALARDVRGVETLAGTPAYMAPEQLAGGHGTARSDIYALGLVLYEIFTGKRLIDASSMVDAVLHHASSSSAATPSPALPDLDPAVERVVLSCLERDPAKRPTSAVLIATMLPGGDPLQAALAAGETPSPEMVAAAGTQETVRPMTGAVLLLTIVTMVLGGAWLRTQVSIAARVPFENSPEVLATKAREMITSFGYSDRPSSRRYGFTYNFPFIRFNATTADAAVRQRRLESGRPPALLFWYRESPASMTAVVVPRAVGPGAHVGPVTEDNPPLVVPGMKLLYLDTKGRLVSFRAISPEFERSGPAPKPPDWAAILAAAGLDLPLTPDEPRWTPPVAADAHAAWTGRYAENPDMTLRVEAASEHGILTAFETFGPWRSTSEVPVAAAAVRPPGAIPAILESALMIVAGLLAWANVRTGRGDRTGAFRLALLLFGLRLANWMLGTDHVAGIEEVTLLQLGLGEAVFNGAVAFVLYLGLEPPIRRRWPRVLIAWNRALAGRVRDPAVGYEILVGMAFAAGLAALNLALIFVTSGSTTSTELNALISVRRIAAGTIDDTGVFVALIFAFLVMLIREVLRREWLVELAVILLVAAIGRDLQGPGGNWWSGLVGGATVGAAIIIALTRFGFMALVTFTVARAWLQYGPVLLQPSAWYSGVSLFLFLVIFGITAWALHTAMVPPKRAVPARI